MLFKVDLRIPAGQASSDPATVEMKLSEGTITHNFVLFPPGCSGLAWAQIWLGGYQLVPWERGQWLRGDDHVIEDFSRYPVAGPLRVVTVKGYNEDGTNPHTVMVGIEVSAPEVVAGLPPPDELLRELGLS